MKVHEDAGVGASGTVVLILLVVVGVPLVWLTCKFLANIKPLPAKGQGKKKQKPKSQRQINPVTGEEVPDEESGDDPIAWIAKCLQNITCARRLRALPCALARTCVRHPIPIHSCRATHRQPAGSARSSRLNPRARGCPRRRSTPASI